MVTLADVTRTGVLAAVAEFDRVGRDAFLRSTGFGRAHTYFLEHDGRVYDSKAIMGYAHGVSTGAPLGPGDFSGGEQTVAPRLEALGFTVRHLPDLTWTRDEIILACELVEANGWKQLPASDDRVVALSELLQSPLIYPLDQRYPDFRNPAGVARKTYNIASVHPGYRGAPTNTNRLDKEVLDEFLDDPAGMHAIAARIRELLAGHAESSAVPDLDEDDTTAGEGGVALRAHLRRERDPRLRRRKIADTKRRGRPIACEKTRLITAELKTRKSRRTLSLTPELVAVLRQHHARQAEARIAAGSLWRDHGLVFTSEVGTPIDPDSFSHTFARMCKQAGLGHWHPHELRHSGASLMLAQGTPLHVVSEVLGHASIAITKDVYGHLVEGDKRTAAESMSRMLLSASLSADGSQLGSQTAVSDQAKTGKEPLTWRARRDSNPRPSDP
jgi:5-methylcytosine-specific restriction enzyme A